MEIFFTLSSNVQKILVLGPRDHKSHCVCCMKVLSKVIKYNSLLVIFKIGFIIFNVNIKTVAKSAQLDLVKVSCLPEEENPDIRVSHSFEVHVYFNIMSCYVSLMAVLSLNFSRSTKDSALLLLDSNMTEPGSLPGLVCSSPEFRDQCLLWCVHRQNSVIVLVAYAFT